jgi:hypothetical protein
MNEGRATCVKWCHARMLESCVNLVPGLDAAPQAALILLGLSGTMVHDRSIGDGLGFISG